MSRRPEGAGAAKLHFVLPTLSWSDPLRLSLVSIESIGADHLGQIIVITPARSMRDIQDGIASLPALGSHVTLVEETGRGVYPGFNDGLRELEGERGYVVFLGAGDIVHPLSPLVVDAMDEGTMLICVPAGGDRATVRRLLGSRGWLTCLPNPQGCLYNLELGALLRYEERLRIYDDVVQRIAIIRKHGCKWLDCRPLISIDGHGVSGAQNMRKVFEHFRERFALLLPLMRHKEPVLALKYVAGSAAMFVRYLTKSNFNTMSGNSI